MGVWICGADILQGLAVRAMRSMNDFVKYEQCRGARSAGDFAESEVRAIFGGTEHGAQEWAISWSTRCRQLRTAKFIIDMLQKVFAAFYSNRDASDDEPMFG
jgi:hypothetical protein